GSKFTFLVPFLTTAGIFCGLFGWLALTGPLALAAWAFNVPPARIRASFITTGWAFLPWLFVAPLHAIRDALGPAAIPLLLIPILWVIFLQFIAVMEAYQAKGWQTLFLVLYMPQMASFMCLWWSTQILSTSLSWFLSSGSTGIF